MADMIPHSVDGHSRNSPDRRPTAFLGTIQPNTPLPPDGELLMGESDPFSPALPLGTSTDSTSSDDDSTPLYNEAQSTLAEVFRAATTLTSKDRLEAIEERKKNQVLLDFLLALGYSVTQLKDFKVTGKLPQTLHAHKVIDNIPATLGGANTIPAEGTSKSAAGIQAVDNPVPKDLKTGQSAHSWSEVVTGLSVPEVPRAELHYYPPVESDGKFTIAPPAFVLQKGLNLWSNSLTGSFLHSKLPFSVVEPFAQKNWGGMGLTKVLLHAKGYYVFKFDTPAARDNILALGPWYISNKLIRLKPWREGQDLMQESCTKTPIWVKFHGVPYSYWTPEGLSFIASGVGKPLFLDKNTERMVPMNFARICVEIGLNSPLPKSLSVTIMNEVADSSALVEVQVEYQRVPPVCLSCQTFGHSRMKCPQANYRWVPKSPVTPTEVSPNAGINSPSVPATEPTSEVNTILSEGCPLPGPSSAAAPISPNPYALLAESAVPSPPSSTSYLNDPLLCKLKVVDEKDKKDALVSGGVPGMDFMSSGTHVGASGTASSDCLQKGGPELMPLASTSVTELNSGGKRRKAKGRKSPQKLPPPPHG